MRTWVTNNRNASGISQYEKRHAMDGVAGMHHRDVCCDSPNSSVGDSDNDLYTPVLANSLLHFQIAIFKIKTNRVGYLF